jgi:hypothetical protein
MTFPVRFLMNIPCEVGHQEPGTADEYGNHPMGPTTTSIETCWLAQSTRGEDDLIEFERWNIYLPPEVTLDANDAVRVEGVQFYVRGAPWRVRDPLTGAPTHIEATLMRRV